MDSAFLVETMEKLFAVLPLTVFLWALSISIGGSLALGLTWMRVSRRPILERIARGYIFVFRGSPLLVQMFLIYYGLGQFAWVRGSVFWPVLRDPFSCAVISLALCTAGYTAEIFRGGLQAVPALQIEAARACGMSGFLILRRIIAPLALRAALPAYSTELVLMMKSTSLASLVTVWEVTGVAQRIIHSTYRTFEVFFVAALIYLVLNFIIVRALGLLEYRLSAHLRARPSRAQPPLPAVAA
jgi:octopine/nopaline transport system permease protein